MYNKPVHCKFCEKIIKNEEAYAEHIYRKHKDLMNPDMTPTQFVYYLRTGRTHGNCVVCTGETKWNEKTNKYNRFCDDPKCKEKYREEFKKRMMDKYGKTTLLNDPEQQKKMLANRKISGKYQWSDRDPRHVFGYTGSYEAEFLVFMDHIIDFDPEDIMMPSPHVYYYMYEGKKHFYIPDCFIPSLNLEIEIKDGGDNPNTHPKIQAVDKIKEKLKDEVVSSKNIPFNYLKIVNNEFMKFFKYLEQAKRNELDGINSKIVMK